MHNFIVNFASQQPSFQAKLVSIYTSKLVFTIGVIFIFTFIFIFIILFYFILYYFLHYLALHRKRKYVSQV